MSTKTLFGGTLAVVILLSTMVVHADDLIPFGASWSYLAPLNLDEDPNLTDDDFDTTWFMTDYDTTSPIAWEGPAPEPLGYGSINGFANGFATELETPASGDRYTAYFRHAFTTTDPQTGLAFETLMDDGAKFYLDGTEILSLNCCATAQPDEIAAFDEFSTAVGNEDLYSIQEVLQGETLAAGDHLLAVALHNQSATSSDLGFSLRFLSDYEPPQPDPNSITEGIDTTLAMFGLNGPDFPHGDLTEWEWDDEDAGGQNHGLLWFDIPQERLDDFGNGTATLQLTVTNEGSNGDVHRITEDWFSGDFGGDDMVWIEMPVTFDGLFPGDNMLEDPTVSTGDLTTGELEMDVTEDVLAWASGEPNYGWGFYPTGTNGVGIASFETDRGPVLVLTPESMGILGDYDNSGALDVADVNILSAALADGDNDPQFDLNGDGSNTVGDLNFMIGDATMLNTWLGDANLDGEFNTTDLVGVFAMGEYEDAVTGNSEWADGDWNADLEFNTSDLVAAFSDGGFEQGPKAVAAVPEASSLVLLCLGLLSLLPRRRVI